MLRCDIAIIGGGMVGAAAANRLARNGFDILLLEKHQPASYQPETIPDLRVSAISPGSARLLKDCECWQAIVTQRACEYARMEVESSSGGRIEFRAGEHGLSQLGWIIENNLIQRQLWEALPDNVQRITGAGFKQMHQSASGVIIELDNDQEITANLVIAADGARSSVREQLKINISGHNYQQRGVVAVLETEQANDGVAWQCFLDNGEYTGPLALLPQINGWSSMVWSMPTETALAVCAYEPEKLAAEITLHSNARFGRVSLLSKAVSFPLQLQLAEKMVEQRVIVLGDAAHQVHPLAGQGVNLGFADVLELSKALPDQDALHNLNANLARFERRRISDNTLMARGIDGLEKLFRKTPMLAGVGMQAVKQILASQRPVYPPSLWHVIFLNQSSTKQLA